MKGKGGMVTYFVDKRQQQQQQQQQVSLATAPASQPTLSTVAAANVANNDLLAEGARDLKQQQQHNNTQSLDNNTDLADSAALGQI